MAARRMMDEQAIQEFWNAHPCGEGMVGALDTTFRGDYERFFEEYDAWKYALESHIPACLDDANVCGKRVLEIGTGEGAEAEQLIRRGARWTGVDLTRESVDRVRTRLTLRGLQFDDLRQASVLDLPFEDDTFDVVFSHGVLHHVPDIDRGQREIHRVLKPGGELIVMVYARWSLNYLVAIGIARRAVLLATYPLIRNRRTLRGGMLEAHVRNAQRIGLGRYLRMREFVHSNTDGPGNPFSNVYDERRLRRDFSMFRDHQDLQALHARAAATGP